MHIAELPWRYDAEMGTANLSRFGVYGEYNERFGFGLKWCYLVRYKKNT